MVMMATVLVAVVAAAVLVAQAVGELARVEHAPKEDGSLTVLAVGDWGRKGQFNQTLVATQMGVIGEQLDVDFVLSTGDNFYNDGLAGDNDTAGFRESFTDIYTATSLQKPWYIVLGNHDYTGDALAQQSAAIRAVDSRWTSVNKSFVVDAGIAEFFLVDTSPFVLRYWNDSKFDWRQVAPRDTYLSNLLTANGAHMYLNGHDHCLQRITSIDSPLQLVTSGGGSKAWAGKFKETSDKLEFMYDGQGFLSMRLTAAEASFAFHDVAGAVLHSWKLTKPTCTKN